MKAVVVALLTAFALPQSSIHQLNPAWAVVLPPDYWPPNMYKWCSRDAPGRSGYWAPDSETIASLEVALPPALQRALDQRIKEPAGRPGPGDYYRQYIGIRKGRRQVVYINGFHRLHVERLRSKFDESWRTRVVNVCDGGTMFFGAEYDPVTRQVENLRFNGPG